MRVVRTRELNAAKESRSIKELRSKLKDIEKELGLIRKELESFKEVHSQFQAAIKIKQLESGQ